MIIITYVIFRGDCEHTIPMPERIFLFDGNFKTISIGWHLERYAIDMHMIKLTDTKLFYYDKIILCFLCIYFVYPIIYKGNSQMRLKNSNLYMENMS